MSDSALRSEDHASRAVGQEPIKNKSFLLIPLLEEGQKAGYRALRGSNSLSAIGVGWRRRSGGRGPVPGRRSRPRRRVEPQGSAAAAASAGAPAPRLMRLEGGAVAVVPVTVAEKGEQRVRGRRNALHLKKFPVRARGRRTTHTAFAPSPSSHEFCGVSELRSPKIPIDLYSRCSPDRPSDRSTLARRFPSTGPSDSWPIERQSERLSPLALGPGQEKRSAKGTINRLDSGVGARASSSSSRGGRSYFPPSFIPSVRSRQVLS